MLLSMIFILRSSIFINKQQSQPFDDDIRGRPFRFSKVLTYLLARMYRIAFTRIQ